jgi:site-specific DNA-methyltransferase (adenine-specific)
MTPQYLAELVIARYFADLGASDLVVEPSCGDGRFLRALPAHVPAIGIELDPLLAEEARRTTGRRVITGDCLTVPLDFEPTCAIGNPMFELQHVRALLARLHPLLPLEGRVGLILPTSVFQTSRTVVDWGKQWSIALEMIPRDLYPGLSLPLGFSIFTKQRRRTLVGFAFYREVRSVRDLPAATQALLADAPEGSVWKAVVTRALTELGGEASLDAIYDRVAGSRPTQTSFWKEQCRKQLQQHHRRIARGRYALAA